MNLIIFDIDGTLTQTTAIDTRCYLKALRTILPAVNINTNWEQYQYSTDSGVTIEIYEYLFNRSPTPQEIKTLHDQFIKNLAAAWVQDQLHFAPINGANKIFAKIAELGNWHIGIATGTWQLSALFKLEKATIPHDNIPKAYANHHVERAEIIKKTISLAKEQHRVDCYQRQIYVGDKDWDFRAARLLNMEFIAVGSAFKQQNAIDLQLTNYIEQDEHRLLTYLT